MWLIWPDIFQNKSTYNFPWIDKVPRQGIEYAPASSPIKNIANLTPKHAQAIEEEQPNTRVLQNSKPLYIKNHRTNNLRPRRQLRAVFHKLKVILYKYYTKVQKTVCQSKTCKKQFESHVVKKPVVCGAIFKGFPSENITQHQVQRQSIIRLL